MNTTHPSFAQPVEGATPAWRYLRLERFVYLLTERALYLSRSDLLGDPHEGTIPSPNAANIRTQFCDPDRPDLIIKARKMCKLFTYVNCWHLNHTESEAMWRLYCPSGAGVALKSTYSKLAKSIASRDIYVGLVRYIDYRSQFMPLDNAFNPIMHKRKVYEHEREARIVTLLPSSIESVERDFDEQKCLMENPRGLKVSFEIESALDGIYMSPYASEQQYAAVREAMGRSSISAPLEWSHIADAPNP